MILQYKWMLSCLDSTEYNYIWEVKIDLHLLNIISHFTIQMILTKFFETPHTRIGPLSQQRDCVCQLSPQLTIDVTALHCTSLDLHSVTCTIWKEVKAACT